MYIYKGIWIEDIRNLALYLYFENKGVEYKDGRIYIEGTPISYRQEAGYYYVSQKTIKKIMRRLYNQHGSSCFRRYKMKTYKDIKRKVIEWPCKDFQKYKHRNVKFHYKCKECGRDVFTTWFLIDHWDDCLCKHCRKTKIKRAESKLDQAYSESLQIVKEEFFGKPVTEELLENMTRRFNKLLAEKGSSVRIRKTRHIPKINEIRFELTDEV